MRNMDSLLEEVIGKPELCGPLIDLYLKEIGKRVVGKLNRSKVTGLVTCVILFIPWPVFCHVLTLERGYSVNVKSSDHGVKHSIVFSKIHSLKKMLSPARFSGENFFAYRHFLRRCLLRPVQNWSLYLMKGQLLQLLMKCNLL